MCGEKRERKMMKTETAENLAVGIDFVDEPTHSGESSWRPLHKGGLKTPLPFYKIK